MDNNKVSITVELSNEEAEALAIFFKRCGFADFNSKADQNSKGEVYLMQDAG